MIGVEGGGASGAAAEPVAALRRVLPAAACGFVAPGLGAPLGVAQVAGLTTHHLRHDVISLAWIGLVLAAAALPLPAGLGRWTALPPRRAMLAFAALTGAAALAGTAAVFHGQALSYDEAMAAFDTRIFLGGRLIAPVPQAWRAFVPALATSFVLPVPGAAGWLSSYLPGNAALRAGFGLIGSPALAGPALAAFAVACAYGIARRAWPGRPDAALVAAALLATAPQVVVTAMTPYAMTAHLALNLAWLWLFLRGGRLGHGGAVAVGFLACGLHQMVFHPLFAAPFLVGLLSTRRWRLAAAYAGAYLAIGLFWTFYWQILLMWTGYAGGGAETVGGVYLVARLAPLLAAFGPESFDVMGKNLIRFAAWQSPMLLPLALLAAPAVLQGEGLARPLAAGLALTTAAMLVLLPYQGHGWGYRYLHGLIGSACLLAAHGWVVVTGDPRARAAAARIFGLGCAAAVLVLIPGHALEAERFAAPYAAAVRAIARAGTDIVIVDDARIAYGADLVRNDPNFGPGPRVLLLRRLDADLRRALCARGSRALFGADQARALGLPAADVDAPSDPLPCATRPVPVP